MKKTSSAGLDGISTSLIHSVAKEIAPGLTKVINASLSAGIFPKIYKCARVTPIFKNKGEKSNKENYRPVSNLNVFGKCLEVCVDVQLREFCEKFDLFGVHQNGFRKF